MEVWVLTFFITAGQLGGRHFLGGEYQSEERCEVGAMAQLPHWRGVYGRRIEWTCRQMFQEAGGKPT